MNSLEEFVENASALLGATKKRLIEGHDVGPFAVMLKGPEMVGALELDDRSPGALLATLDIVRSVMRSQHCDAVMVVFHADSIMVTEEQAQRLGFKSVEDLTTAISSGDEQLAAKLDRERVLSIIGESYVGDVCIVQPYRIVDSQFKWGETDTQSGAILHKGAASNLLPRLQAESVGN